MKLLTFALAFTMLATPTFAQTNAIEGLKMSPNTPVAFDSIGWSVDFDVDIAIVSGHIANGYIGEAYIMDMITGNELFELSASDGVIYDFFGGSVAIHDFNNRAIVGAIGADSGGSNRGQAYIYNTSNGNELYILTANDQADNDWLGHSVAFGGFPSGTIAVAGAPKADDLVSLPNVPGAGAVYVFSTALGTQLAKFEGTGGVWYADYGYSVDANDDWILIGSPSDSGTYSLEGSAYYREATFPYAQTKLVASDNSTDARFGSAVALSGDYAVVAARGVLNNGNTGVYVFDLSTGTELYKIEDPLLHGPLSHFSFAQAIAVDGNRILIGDYLHIQGDPTLPRAGAVYVYELSSGDYLGHFIPNAADDNDQFGISLAIQGNVALVGANGDGDNGIASGTAIVFELGIGNLLCSPNEDNSSGGPAILEAYGSIDASDNDFTLRAIMGVTNEVGYPLTSLTTGFVPFSGSIQGNLCLGGSIGRFTGLVASGGADGIVDFSIDLTNIPTTPVDSVMAGETWHFQVWYRDFPNSNYTNGLSVRFF